MAQKQRAIGEGTICQRPDGRWSGHITLPNGKRKTKYGKTQGDVRDWLTEQRGAVNAGNWSDVSNVKLKDFLAAYLRDVVKDQVRPTTLMMYERHVRLHINPELGPVKLTSLRPEHLQAFYTKKLESGLSLGATCAASSRPYTKHSIML